MHYEKITTEILEKLKAIVGPKDVVTDADAMQPYSHDEVTDPAYHHMPEVVVFAETAQQVSAIIKLANACHFPVVPRGAGTGLACGAVPEYGGIVLSLEKMNKILEINEDGLYAVVEPGVRTSDLQEAAEKKGLFYAGDPCSGDSCFIGGNIATNAGGNRAVKYGTTRHQVYSVEVVNPTGRIVNLGARLQKQSTGYSLDQLVIGSEGTLGIITKATLKLLPKPKYALDLLAIFDDRRQAMGVVTKIIKAGITPTCVEFMDNITIKSVEKYLNENLQGSDNGNSSSKSKGPAKTTWTTRPSSSTKSARKTARRQSSSLTTIRSGRPARPLPKPSAPKASSSAKKTSSFLSTRKRPSSTKSCAWPRNTTWSHVSPATPATATFT